MRVVDIFPAYKSERVSRRVNRVSKLNATSFLTYSNAILASSAEL